MANILEKILGGQAPYTDQRTNLATLLSNIGGQMNLQGAGALGTGETSLAAGQGGLTAAAQGAGATGQALTDFGVSGVSGLTDTLTNIGGKATGGGLNTATGASDVLGGAGAGAIASGAGMLGQAVNTETTGNLPPGAQAAVDQNTQDAINNIKGRFAALGMSGSTEEATAISNAMQQGMINKFQIATQMGQIEGQQGLSQEQIGFGGVGTAGGLGLGVAGIGLGAFGQSGNLLTALDSLGFNYSSLSSQDWNAIAGQGLSAMGIGAGLESGGVSAVAGGANIFSNLAGDQMKEDSMLSSTIQSFFNAMGKGFGQQPAR